jgi:hypothetical protein
VLGDAGIPLFEEASFAVQELRDVVIETLAPDVLIRGYTGTWAPAEARR